LCSRSGAFRVSGVCARSADRYRRRIVPRAGVDSDRTVLLAHENRRSVATTVSADAELTCRYGSLSAVGEAGILSPAARVQVALRQRALWLNGRGVRARCWCCRRQCERSLAREGCAASDGPAVSAPFGCGDHCRVPRSPARVQVVGGEELVQQLDGDRPLADR
jgi:hypothetical protein